MSDTKKPNFLVAAAMTIFVVDGQPGKKLPGGEI